MKTLKKTLCLVLAVVLTVGVLVLPAYADREDWTGPDGYTDKADVTFKYEEAVGTLSGMGVLNGKRDEKNVKTFKPQQKINRAEAITLIVRALLSKAQDSLPKENTKFTDVPKTHYASQYVAYAVEKGIVAGKSSTYFAANDEVTGYELAKMALIAAGIKAPSDFNKSNWQTVAGSGARLAGLLEGIDEDVKDLNTPLTREQAAQMIWNMVTYVPETVTLDVVKVNEPNAGDTYKVTFPEESIAGKVYDLTAFYNFGTPRDIQHETWQDAWGRPSVQYSNGKLRTADEVIYYTGICCAVNQFYAENSLTKADLAKHSSAAADDAIVYVDGYTDLPATTSPEDGYRILTKATPATTTLGYLNLTNKEGTALNNRGARVSIFKAPDWWVKNRGVKYLVYVDYQYATYNVAETATGEKAVAVPDKTAHHIGMNVTLNDGLGAKSIAVFNLMRYDNTATVHNPDAWHGEIVKDATSKTKVQITARNNNSRDPYFRVSGNTKKTYVAAMAIYVDAAGNVSPLHFYKQAGDTNNYINVDSSKYYNVWYDWAGNVIALQETTGDKPTATIDHLGYVLEFTCVKGVTDKDDMNTSKNSAAKAYAVLVDLKTGNVERVPVAVKYIEDEKNDTISWYTIGINGENVIKIETTIEGIAKIDEIKEQDDKTQAFLHSFVAYKQTDSGDYAITPIGAFKNDYKVVEDFSTDGNDLGVVTTDLGTLYANNSTEVTVLNDFVLTADKSRIAKYIPDQGYKGYNALNDIVTLKDDDEILDSTKGSNAPHKVHIGVQALFKYNSKTNMIEEAYVFGEQLGNVQWDYYILKERDVTNQGKGTYFTLQHEGKEDEVCFCNEEQVLNLFVNFDNAKDAGTVVLVKFGRNAADGKRTIIDMIAVPATRVDSSNKDALKKFDSSVEEGTLFCVSGTIKGVTTDGVGYVALNNAAEHPIYFSSGCVAYDSVTKTFIKLSSLEVGDAVTVYYSSSLCATTCLIVI